jgi:flavin reductase (DIM6/NTAB) family NADH-FMN oxidoreductase RutF
MYFDPREVGMAPPPFKYTVFNSLVVPRPIGWITTMDVDGVINLAPFSFFNAISAAPPCVIYCPSYFKPGFDEPEPSLVNVKATGEFVYNMCTHDLREKMVLTTKQSPRSPEEFTNVGLEVAPCHQVKPPRVKEAPVALECKYVQSITLPATEDGAAATAVIGQIVGIHISDDVITEDGLVDMKNLRPLARLGYYDFAVIEPEQIFSMQASGDNRFAPDGKG